MIFHLHLFLDYASFLLIVKSPIYINYLQCFSTETMFWVTQDGRWPIHSLCCLLIHACCLQLRLPDHAIIFLMYLGDHAFAVAGPRLWNALPISLRQPHLSLGQFRRALETHLFDYVCRA